MRIELAIYRAERRLRKIADSQYWAERSLVDAAHPEPGPTDSVSVACSRIAALDEIYKDLLERINDA